jgi:DNA-binding winged helix-turn-helix (wHTH) protein
MSTDVSFGEFRFDPANQCLWRGHEMIALTPKGFAVLRCLVERAGQLVTKDALLDAAWPDTAVTDASLKVCVQDLRRLLGDSVGAPRYIATVHRRGYRFIAEIVRPAPTVVGRAVDPLGGRFVGRDQPLAVLHAAFERADAGARQVVFVTGEAGIGKTTLAEAFLARIDGGARLARGRCIEQFGSVEPYLPLLESLGRLCRAQPDTITALRRRAPTWLAQMPWLIAEGDRAGIDRDVLGGTPARMLRELAEVIEALASERALVLSLEDVHWSDPSTLDAVAFLAQRPEPARLLLLLTYRPAEAGLTHHPVRALKQRLVVQGRCVEVALELLTADDVQAYLSARLGTAPPAGLADAVHRRTDGNPLFMVAVADDIVAGGRVDADGVRHLSDDAGAVAERAPESVRRMVEQQAERLAASDLALLEAAALARAEFPVALVAAALGLDALAVEQRCEELARQGQWLVGGGVAELPDGAASSTYRFTHAVYRDVLGQRMAPSRRAQVHLRLGDWVERTYGERAAAELALHFEEGRDLPRAVRYLRAAARTATARCAHREALGEMARALTLAERLPDAGREAMRRALLEQRGVVHRARGDVAAAVADFDSWAASARADGDGREEVRALLALSGAWSLRDRARCLALAEQAVERCRQVDDVDLIAQARGSAAYWRARLHGWSADDARASSAAVAAARRIGRPAALAPHLGMEAMFANLRGDYAGAAAAGVEGMACAERGGDSFAHTLCRFQQTWALQHAGQWGALLMTLHDGLRAAERNGHEAWAVVFRLLLGGWQNAAGLEGAAAGALLAAARASGHDYGIASGLLVVGWSALGRGATARARAAFEELGVIAGSNPAAVEWVLRMPLHVGLGACALAAGDAVRAEEEASRACALAAVSGEPTYLALGHRVRAVAAMAERRWDDAAGAVADAQAVVERADAPIAAWQVWATAGALARARGRAAEARAHRSRAAAVLERLASSLDVVDEATAAALGVSLPAAQAAIRGRSRGRS